MIQSEAATRIASFAIGSARERKKEGILCSFVWVFAWFYISSVVSPARRDIFVTPQVSDSYTIAGTTTSTTTPTTNTTATTTAATTTTAAAAAATTTRARVV